MSKNVAALPSYQRSAFDYSGMEPAAVSVVQQAAGRIRDRQRAAIVDIGRELNAVKDALPHGQFIPWLRAEFGWSHGTALNYMRVADTIGDKFATVAHLPPAFVYKLAAPSTPPEIREQVLRIDAGKSIDPREIIRLIDDTKERQEKVRRKSPTPEDLAKAKAKERREAREFAKLEAQIEAGLQIARQAAQAIKDALGGRLPEMLAAMQEQPYRVRETFMTELFKPATQEATR